MGFGFYERPRAAHVDRTDRTVHGFFERDHDVAFDVAPALGKFLFLQTRRAAKSRPPRIREPKSCSKKSLKPVPPK